MGRVTERRRVIRISTANGPTGTGGAPAADRRAAPDTLVAEEPLEIRIGRSGGPRPPLAVTMRTPGDDLDLAIGFLLTEGVIAAAPDVVTAVLCAGTNEPDSYNVVDVTLAGHVPPPAVDLSRNFYTTSSCGVCGKASVDAVRTRSRFVLTGDQVPGGGEQPGRVQPAGPGEQPLRRPQPYWQGDQGGRRDRRRVAGEDEP